MVEDTCASANVSAILTAKKIIWNGTKWNLFRHLTFIPFSTWVKLVMRKEKGTLHPESDLLSGNDKKERIYYEQ